MLVTRLVCCGCQVSALSAAQLLSYDSVTVARRDESGNGAKFRLTRDTLPAPLLARVHDRAALALPPDFSAVDACLLPAQRAENGPCADKFSNPKYFEHQWLAEQVGVCPPKKGAVPARWSP